MTHTFFQDLCILVLKYRQAPGDPAVQFQAIERGHNKANHYLFAGGGPCLAFVRDTTPVKRSKAKHNN